MKSQICVRIDYDTEQSLRAMCRGKGDLTMHIDKALAEYVERRQEAVPKAFDRLLGFPLKSLSNIKI